jgi:hypothetical protein
MECLYHRYLGLIQVRVCAAMEPQSTPIAAHLRGNLAIAPRRRPTGSADAGRLAVFLRL